jgi:hypothetical protein
MFEMILRVLFGTLLIKNLRYKYISMPQNILNKKLYEDLLLTNSNRLTNSGT